MKHKFLLLAALLCCSLGAWAGYDISNTYFYFDNTRSNWEVTSTKSIYVYIHKDSNTGRAYKMTRIPNTNLYYYYRGSTAWQGATNVAFLYVESTSSEISSGSRSVSGILQYTAYQTLDKSLDGYYILGRIEEGASGDNAALHWDRKDSWSSKGTDSFLAGILHREQTVHVRLSTDGSTYSGQGDWGNNVLCNIAADYWQMNSDTKTSTTSVHKDMTHSNQTATGVRSSVQTFVASAVDGYKITGWGLTDEGPSSSSATYEYTVTATATHIYAYVEQGRTINVAVADGQEALGNVNVAAITYFTGDAPTITATCTSPIHVFDHWEVASDDATLASTTDASTKITSASSNSTIKAHFRLRGTVNLTISNAKYASWYGADNLVIPDGITAQYVTDWNNTILSWETLNDYIPAETGVILSGAPGTYIAYVTSETETVSGNMLKGTLTDEVINNACVHYILSAESDGSRVGFYWPNEATVDDYTGVGQFTNHANKAYLELPASGANSAPRRYVFGENMMPTDIENVQGDKVQSTKVIENGVLYLMYKGTKYNVQGQVVK